MKRFLTIILLGLSLFGISQSVVIRATQGNTVQDSRLQAQFNLFVPRYADTTAANVPFIPPLGGNIGIDSCGAIIFTYDINNFWVRACSPKRWVRVQGQQVLPDGVYSGGDVGWTGTNLDFFETAAIYVLNGVPISSPTVNPLTLDPSDPTFSRIDLIGLGPTGPTIITGTPAASPQEPSYNPQIFIRRAAVLVEAGALTPTITTNIIYDEDLGLPDEWTPSSTGTTSFTANTTPYHLTLFANTTAITTAQHVSFTFSDTVNSGPRGSIVGFIRLATSMATNQNFNIQLYYLGASVSPLIPLTNYGVFRNINSQYQPFVIPMPAFGASNVVFDEIRIIPTGGGTFPVFGLDFLQFQTGFSPTVTSRDFAVVDNLSYGPRSFNQNGFPFTYVNPTNLANMFNIIGNKVGGTTSSLISFQETSVTGVSPFNVHPIFDLRAPNMTTGQTIGWYTGKAYSSFQLSNTGFRYDGATAAQTGFYMQAYGQVDPVYMFWFDSSMFVGYGLTKLSGYRLGVNGRGSFKGGADYSGYLNSSTLSDSSFTPRKYVDSLHNIVVGGLQAVTDIGNTTTNSIAANIFFVKPPYTSDWVLSPGYTGNGTTANGQIDFRETSTGAGNILSLMPADDIGSADIRLFMYGNDADTLATRAYARSLLATSYFNSNVGSSFRWAIPNTNNIKTLRVLNGILADSVTANTLSIQVDSSQYATKAFVNSVAGGGGFTGVTSVSVVTANGLAGTVANPTTTPAITLTTSITGVLKGNGTAISAATSGTDYSLGTSALATGILKSTTGTGALTIAVSGTDYVVPSVTTLSSLVSVGTMTTGSISTGFIVRGVTMTLGADASFDTYYRSAGGVLTRLANGTSGQFLGANTGAAPTWQTPAVTAGVSSITGTANQVIASAATGAVTLSLPQSIATTSTPTFRTLTVGGTAATPPLIFTTNTDAAAAAGRWYYNTTRLGFSLAATILRVPLTNDVTPANGQIPIGNGANYTVSAITPSNNTTVITNGAGSITIGSNMTPQTLADGATITFNGANGYNATVTLGGTGRTLARSNWVAGATYTLRIVQDGTGNRTITTWPTGIRWPSGTPPTLATAAGSINIVAFYFDGTLAYGAFQSGAYQ